VTAGAIVNWTCSHCRQVNSAWAKECGRCGRPNASAPSPDQVRLETCTCCGIRRGHTISCDVGNGAAPSDDLLRNHWRRHGGSFHGPNVETGTMPEALLLPFLRGLVRKP
jgi:hypothetical protein